MRSICIIPAFNEEKNILKAVEDVKKYVDEIIVVDDGSSDKTYDEARKAGVFVLRHFINRGQGAALETGNSFAMSLGAELVVHFDADGQFFASEIPEIIDPIKKGEADAVFGSRFMGRPNNMPAFKKKFIIPIASMVNQVILGIKMTDPQSGFRALSRDVLDKIKIKQDKMAHCSEILYKVKKSGARIKEVPISVHYHHFGQRLTQGIRVVKDLLLAKLMD